MDFLCKKTPTNKIAKLLISILILCLKIAVSLEIDLLLGLAKQAIESGFLQITTADKVQLDRQYEIAEQEQSELMSHIYTTQTRDVYEQLKNNALRQTQREVQGVPFFFAYFLVNLFLQLETNMVM